MPDLPPVPLHHIELAMTRDLVSGAALFAFAVIYYLAASAIPVSMLADTVGAQGLPKSYGIVLGILSLLLILQTLYARRRLGPPAAAEVAAGATKDRKAALRAFGMIAIGAVYVLLLPYLGYIISLALLIGTTAWYQERTRRRWLWATAIIGAVVFWGIFVKMLQIAEPAGLWPSLF